MTQTLDSGAERLLRTLLGEDSPLLTFAEAVVTHLSTPPASLAPADDVIGRVMRILRGIAEPSDDLPLDLLLAEPAILASFFQNADLLDPRSPETGVIAHLMMEALERISDRPE